MTHTTAYDVRQRHYERIRQDAHQRTMKSAFGNDNDYPEDWGIE